MPIARKVGKSTGKKLASKKPVGNKRAVGKKAAVKTSTSKKALRKNAPAKKRTRNQNELPAQFTPGSDLETAFIEMQRGGETRLEISHRLRDMWDDHLTQAGNKKPVATIMNQVMQRALNDGWTVESSWRLVPPPGVTPSVSPEVVEKVKSLKKPAKKAKKGVKTLRRS